MFLDHATVYARDDICFTFKAGNFGVLQLVFLWEFNDEYGVIRFKYDRCCILVIADCKRGGI